MHVHVYKCCACIFLLNKFFYFLFTVFAFRSGGFVLFFSFLVHNIFSPVLNWKFAAPKKENHKIVEFKKVLIKIVDMIGMLNRVDGCVYMLFHVPL